MMILWFVLIGILVYFLVGGDWNLNSFQRKSAGNHLDERLAKGEISIEEYQKLKTTLKENE
ncbi:MAG: SHOCT domain-containing protein [Candidatus Izemoplasmataceae bacterium]|jgi:uncharacterized membrane protein